MKRSFMLLAGILFVVVFLEDRTIGRESPYYRNVENAVESEDHPWGGDGTGSDSSVNPKGRRNVLSSASTPVTFRLDMWLSQLVLRFVIPSKTPTAAPVTPAPTNNASSNGGTN